jgi:hypothetical protein
LSLVAIILENWRFTLEPGASVGAMELTMVLQSLVMELKEEPIRISLLSCYIL